MRLTHIWDTALSVFLRIKITMLRCIEAARRIAQKQAARHG
jgi:hypothetical protein